MEFGESSYCVDSGVVLFRYFVIFGFREVFLFVLVG